MTLTDPRLEALKHSLTEPGRKGWAAIDRDAAVPVHEFTTREEAETHVADHGGRLYRRLGHGLAWEAVA